MNIIGKWVVSSVLSFDGGDFKWLTEEEASLKEDFDARTFAMIMDFMPDGTVRTMMKIPDGMSQEKIDEALEEGYERDGDCFVIKKEEWKEEDGKILYNSGIQGQFSGEEVSPWAEITQEENGEITFMNFYRMKKM